MVFDSARDPQGDGGVSICSSISYFRDLLVSVLFKPLVNLNS